MVEVLYLYTMKGTTNYKGLSLEAIDIQFTGFRTAQLTFTLDVDIYEQFHDQEKIVIVTIDNDFSDEEVSEFREDPIWFIYEHYESELEEVYDYFVNLMRDNGVMSIELLDYLTKK